MWKLRSSAVLLSCALASLTSHAEYIPDAKTAKLADCGDVMAYAANYALMSNNEGLARVYFFQHARAVVALFAKNYIGGAIPGERTAAWKARSPSTKRYLDANQSSLKNEINICLPIIQEALDDPSVANSRMWGKDFSEMVELMSEKTRTQYGLK